MFFRYTRWTRQPQYPVGIDGAFPYKSSLIGALLPGVADSANAIRSYGGKYQPTSYGSPTGYPFGAGRNGKTVRLDFRGGSYGITQIGWPVAAHADSDPLVLFWSGVISPSPINDLLYAKLGGRGEKDSWSEWFGFDSSGNLKAEYVDNPTTAAYGVTLPCGQAYITYQRVAVKKVGATISVYHWGTRTTASSTAGNGSFRTNATFGVTLGLTADTSGGQPYQGINDCESFTAIAANVPDSYIWSLLDNPWQLFAP